MENIDRMRGKSIIAGRIYLTTISALCVTLAFIWFTASAAWGAAAPKAPTNLIATAASSRQINLTWKDNATNETNYYVERAPTSTGTWTQIASLGANVTSYSDIGLPQNTIYYYRVRCKAGTTYSSYSSTANAKTATLAAPTALTATVASASQINLSWTDNTTYETNYYVERAPTSTGPWTQIASLGADVTSYSDTGLTTGTTYYYRVRAYDGTNYSSYSNTANATAITITASAGTGGAISPSGTILVSYGTNQTFTITPNTGYHVSDVQLDEASVGAVTSYTFTNVTANHTITASFAINTYAITATANANGTISPSGAVSVNSGATQTFTMTPNTGYYVSDVQVDGASVGSVASYTFTNITANHTITASFAIDIPVGLWHMDGDWADSSGNGNNGTAYNGAMFSTDAQVGSRAGSLDGVFGYVEIKNPTAALNIGSQSWTISAWIKSSYAGTRSMTILSRYECGWNNCISPDGNASALVSLYLTGSGFAGMSVRSDNGVSVNVSDTVDIRNGKWHQIVGMLDRNGNLLKIFVDGNVRSSASAASLNAVNDAGSPLEIGRTYASWTTYQDYFSGLIDEVALYNRMMTNDEINRHYSEGLGRVGLWHLDGDWTDASGHGNNGTGQNGATFSTDARVGSQSGSFDGVTDYAEISNPAAALTVGEQSWTVAAWIKSSYTGTGVMSVVSRTGNADAAHSLFVDGSGFAGMSVRSDNGDSATASDTVNIRDGKWHQIVGMLDRKAWVLKLFVDGKERNNVSAMSLSGVNDAGSPLEIGRTNVAGGTGQNYFSGLVDEIAIYNRAMTNEEITLYYNKGLGLVGTWHMDGDWTDASGNSNNGTGQNGVTFSTDAQVGSQAGSFDGVDDSVEKQSPGSELNIGSGDFTIAAWVKTSYAGTVLMEIVSRYECGWNGCATPDGNANAYYQLFINGSGGAGLALRSDNGNAASVSDTGNIRDGSWHYVAGVLNRSGGVLAIYVDGVKKQSASASALDAINDAGSPFEIGRQYQSWAPPTSYFSGLMDEVAVYNRALAADEILKNYNDQKAPTVIITSPEAGVITTATPLLAYSINRGAVVVKVDGVVVSKVSGDTLGPLPAGPHTVRVEATDAAGNTGFDEVHFTIDLGPTVVIISPTSVTTRNNTPLLDYTVSDSAVVVVVRVDGNVVSKVSGDTLDALSNGPHTVRVEATDAAGSTGFAEVPFTVDTTMPLTLSGVLTSTNAINTLSEAATIFFTVNDNATVTLKIIPEKQGPTGTPIYQTSKTVNYAGASYFTWDGRDGTGKIVPDEAYLYILQATDGTNTSTYSPPAPTGTGTVSCTQDTYNPYQNDPMTINSSVAQPSRISATIFVNGYVAVKLLDAAPCDAGSYSYDWDGTDGNGNVVISGTAQCSVTSLLRENHIITTGDTPAVGSIKTDPSSFSLSYGQFTRIKYVLSRDAVVTIAAIPPSGSTITIISGQSQSSGANEVEWNVLDASDATGKKFLAQQEGPYAIKIQAVNPVTGTGSSTTGFVKIQQ